MQYVNVYTKSFPSIELILSGCGPSVCVVYEMESGIHLCSFRLDLLLLMRLQD